MDTMLNMTQQCALATKNAFSLLDYIRQSIARKLSEKILPLHSALVRHVRGGMASAGYHYKRDMDVLEQV